MRVFTHKWHRHVINKVSLLSSPTSLSALGVSHVMRYINLRYLLTYLLTNSRRVTHCVDQ